VAHPGEDWAMTFMPQDHYDWRAMPTGSCIRVWRLKLFLPPVSQMGGAAAGQVLDGIRRRLILTGGVIVPATAERSRYLIENLGDKAATSRRDKVANLHSLSVLTGEVKVVPSE